MSNNYLYFTLVTFLILLLDHTSAYPRLRSRRTPLKPGDAYASPWRRQAEGKGRLVNDLLSSIKKALNVTTDDEYECSNCTAIKKENDKLKEEIAENDIVETKHLRPAYECDEWDNHTRTCWLDRNIGDTVTFVLSFAEGANPMVQWRQEFRVLKRKKRIHFDIDPETPLWNMVVGSRGHEMRLSPITEMDVDSNLFSATVRHKDKDLDKTPPEQIVHFRIRVMPVDQGFVYPGETLMLNMKSVDLPPTSMKFQWHLERNVTGVKERSLPSNMKVSPSGAVLSIWELRKEQEGVVACSVYTNKGFLATKKRFLINEISRDNNQLLFEPTRPSKPNRPKRDLSSGDSLKWAFRNLENNGADAGVDTDSGMDGHKNVDTKHLRPFRIPQNNEVDLSDATDLDNSRLEDRDTDIKHLRPFRIPQNEAVDPNADMYFEDHGKDARQSRSLRLGEVGNSYNMDSENMNKELQTGGGTSYGMDPGSKDQSNDSRHSRSFGQPGMDDKYDKVSKFGDHLPEKRKSRSFLQPGGDASFDMDSKLGDDMPDNRQSRSFKQPEEEASYDIWNLEDHMHEKRQSRAPRKFEVDNSYDMDLKSEDDMPVDRQSRSHKKVESKDKYEYEEEDEDDGLKIGRQGIENRSVTVKDDSSIKEDLDDPDDQDAPPLRHEKKKGEGDEDNPARRQGGNYNQVLEIERKPVARVNPQDSLSRMIATCDGDLQCSGDAVCIKREPDQTGFCRCNAGFQGSGIFCWEENQAKNAFAAEVRQEENRVKTPELRLEPPETENEEPHL